MKSQLLTSRTVTAQDRSEEGRCSRQDATMGGEALFFRVDQDILEATVEPLSLKFLQQLDFLKLLASKEE